MVPGWEIDRYNENVHRGFMGWRTGTIRHLDLGCSYLGGLLSGTRGVIIFSIATLTLGYFGWHEQLANQPEGTSAFSLTGPFWFMAGGALAGYIAGRLTDKGPVGPLE